MLGLFLEAKVSLVWTHVVPVSGGLNLNELEAVLPEDQRALLIHSLQGEHILNSEGAGSQYELELGLHEVASKDQVSLARYGNDFTVIILVKEFQGRSLGTTDLENPLTVSHQFLVYEVPLSYALCVALKDDLHFTVNYIISN